MGTLSFKTSAQRQEVESMISMRVLTSLRDLVLLDV